jgi:hypothetical protein
LKHLEALCLPAKCGTSLDRRGTKSVHGISYGRRVPERGDAAPNPEQCRAMLISASSLQDQRQPAIPPLILRRAHLTAQHGKGDPQSWANHDFHLSTRFPREREALAPQQHQAKHDPSALLLKTTRVRVFEFVHQKPAKLQSVQLSAVQ